MAGEPTLSEQLATAEAGLRRLAGDLGGLGLLAEPDADRVRARELADLGGVAALELEVIRQSLAELAAKVNLLRDRHVARQLAALGPLPSTGLRLCLTGSAPPGWIESAFRRRRSSSICAGGCRSPTGRRASSTLRSRSSTSPTVATPWLSSDRCAASWRPAES